MTLHVHSAHVLQLSPYSQSQPMIYLADTSNDTSKVTLVLITAFQCAWKEERPQYRTQRLASELVEKGFTTILSGV